MKTNLQTNSRKVDKTAALAAWNASAHPSKWRPNASSIPPYKSFGVFKNRYATRDTRCFCRGALLTCSFRWSLDRTRLRELTAEAEAAEAAEEGEDTEDTEEAEEAQGQQ